MSATEIGVSSVKTLPKRRTRRIYARDTKDTGVGSDAVLQSQSRKGKATAEKRRSKNMIKF